MALEACLETTKFLPFPGASTPGNLRCAVVDSDRTGEASRRGATADPAAWDPDHNLPRAPGPGEPDERAKVSRVTDQRDQLGEEPESGQSAASGQTHPSPSCT
ncbi:hypothetical protein AHiyo4_45930 [Arthrobacter sp. Hiyo4]|nr:hypothetical protein AHiyo4_45930 [Arthrobacter sp. Hiyo4]